MIADKLELLAVIIWIVAMPLLVGFGIYLGVKVL